LKQLVLFYYNNKSFIASDTAVLQEANLHFDFNRLLNCYLEIKNVMTYLLSYSSIKERWAASFCRQAAALVPMCVEQKVPVTRQDRNHAMHIGRANMHCQGGEH
jgi:hypothetical protein